MGRCILSPQRAAAQGEARRRLSAALPPPCHSLHMQTSALAAGLPATRGCLPPGVHVQPISGGPLCAHKAPANLHVPGRPPQLGKRRRASITRWWSSWRNLLLKEIFFFPLNREIRAGWATPKRIYNLNPREFVGIAVEHGATLVASFNGSEMDYPHRLWRLHGERSSSLQLSSGHPSTRALLRW